MKYNGLKKGLQNIFPDLGWDWGNTCDIQTDSFMY